MKEIFSKITEIEKKAQLIADEAKEAEKKFPETVKASLEAIDADYEKKLKKMLEQKTKEENEKADARIEKIVEESSAELSKLKQYFDENEAAWEKEIFRNIIE